MKTQKLINLYTVLAVIVAISITMSCKKSAINPTTSKASGFSTGGVDYNTGWVQITDVGAGGALGNIDVVTTPDTLTFFVVYNMPKQSSGAYTFTNGKNNDNGSQLYAICELGDPTVAYYSTGGSITKTSANTFTFSCSMVNSSTGKNITVTGQGSY